MSTWLANCLVFLTLRSSINAINLGNGESCHKPVHCYADSPNCTLFDHQTVIFVCECLNKDCITAWISNNDVIKTTTGPEYTTNVTRDIAGVMICKTDSNNFKWNVTVLPSTKPRFVAPLSGGSFGSKISFIGDGQTCNICVNCSVIGDPEAYVTWEYQTDESIFNPVFTNQTHPRSRYFVVNNGQVLCFNDIRNYALVENIYYQCTACNVAGHIAATLTGIVRVLYPLPEPGPKVTTGTINSRGHNVTLTMYTEYEKESTFRVCRYNRSSPNNLSCCHCHNICDWGELYCYSNEVNNKHSCQLTTSQVGQYQFQILTINYPCYFDIGDPIEVESRNHKFDTLYIIVVSCLGGLVIIILLSAVIGYYKYKKYRRRHVANGSYVDEQVGVHRPLLSPTTAPDRGTENYGSTVGTAKVADKNTSSPSTSHLTDDETPAVASIQNENDIVGGENTSATSPSTDHIADNGASAGAAIQQENVCESNGFDEQLPLPATDDDKTEPVPSTCKALAYYHYRKTVYIAHGSDSEYWVINTLKPFLAELNVNVFTISDAIPGQTQAAAHVHFVNEANKIILVMSNKSIKDHYFSYDMNQAMHKDPAPTVIPILYENISPSDVPAEVKHLISISNNDPKLRIKITMGIYS